MKCIRCGREANPLDFHCRRCGTPVRATDTRLCPYCGKLKDPFLEKCEECENSYVSPEMRAPILPAQPSQERVTAICPACGNRRTVTDADCCWCNSKMPPLFPDPP